MRPPLALLLVLHYLLGVLGGAWATVTRAPAPSAAHPYVHAAVCQTHNYLRLDCFDSCNGEQPGHFLKQLATGDDGSHHRPNDTSPNAEKALFDVHLLVAAVLVPVRPLYGRALLVSAPVSAPPLATGVLAVESPPPKSSLAFLA
jgi:hypothetical protein